MFIMQVQELFIMIQIEYFVSKIFKVQNKGLNSCYVIQAQENPKKKITIAD